MDAPSAIIFYDGLCGLCNRLNPFILKRDRVAVFRFAPLQSEFARDLLAKYDVEAGDLAMLYLLVDQGLPTERLLSRAEAVLYVLGQLGSIWKVISLLSVLPDWLLNAAYDLVARNRYRLLGRYDACPLPKPEWRERFIETAVPDPTSQVAISLVD